MKLGLVPLLLVGFLTQSVAARSVAMRRADTRRVGRSSGTVQRNAAKRKGVERLLKSNKKGSCGKSKGNQVSVDCALRCGAGGGGSKKGLINDSALCTRTCDFARSPEEYALFGTGKKAGKKGDPGCNGKKGINCETRACARSCSSDRAGGSKKGDNHVKDNCVLNRCGDCFPPEQRSSPVAVCRNLEVCRGTMITARDIDDSFDDDGKIVERFLNKNKAFARVGTRSRTLTVVDDDGLSSSCESTIVVVNCSTRAPPVAVCKDICIFPGASITPEDINNFSSGTGEIDLELDQEGPFSAGTFSVTLTVTDDLMFRSSCQSNVLVTQDCSRFGGNLPPPVPVPVTAVCKPFTVCTKERFSASDLNGGSTGEGLTFSLKQPNFVQNVKTKEYTLFVTDQNGDVSTCISSVTSIDCRNPTPPTPATPSPVDFIPSFTPEPTNPTRVEAVCQTFVVCAGEQFMPEDVDGGSKGEISTRTLNRNVVNRVRVTTVELTVADAAGNRDTCLARIEAIDCSTPSPTSDPTKLPTSEPTEQSPAPTEGTDEPTGQPTAEPLAGTGAPQPRTSGASVQAICKSATVCTGEVFTAAAIDDGSIGEGLTFSLSKEFFNFPRTANVRMTVVDANGSSSSCVVPVAAEECRVAPPVPAITPSPTETTPSPSENDPSPTPLTPSPVDSIPVFDTPNPTESTPAPTALETTPSPTTPVITPIPTALRPITPLPTETTPSPSENDPSPTPLTPSPVDSIPVFDTPSPTESTPAPTALETTPSPTTPVIIQTPAPTGGTPGPTEGSPAPTEGTPAPTGGTPSPTEGTPSPTNGIGSTFDPSPDPTEGNAPPTPTPPTPTGVGGCAIERFDLYDAISDSFVSELPEFINMAELYQRWFAVLAIVAAAGDCNGVPIRSVKFALRNGPQRVEGEDWEFCDRRAPFSLYGDTNGNFTDKIFPVGANYVVEATPYTTAGCDGTPAGPTKSQTFSAVGPGNEVKCPGLIMYYDMYDSRTDNFLGTIREGDKICPQDFDIGLKATVINCLGDRTNSVKFLMEKDGQVEVDRLELGNPFFYLLGDIEGNSVGRRYEEGSYTITATNYDDDKAMGLVGNTLVANFVVSDDDDCINFAA